MCDGDEKTQQQKSNRKRNGNFEDARRMCCCFLLIVFDLRMDMYHVLIVRKCHDRCLETAQMQIEHTNQFENHFSCINVLRT